MNRRRILSLTVVQLLVGAALVAAAASGGAQFGSAWRLALLRERPETAGLPIVLLTARDSNPEILEGWQSGADYYITKPFELEHLLYFIELMQEKAKRDSLRTDPALVAP